MPYRHRRQCPICFKPDLLSLSHHLSQVHHLNSPVRKPYLQAAVFSNGQFPPFISHPYYNISPPQPSVRQPPPPKVEKVVPNPYVEAVPYPDFTFNHMFSMLVVGPSQCGKTYFVQKMLTEHCIQFSNKKKIRITWYYNQWQPCYKTLQSTLGDTIHFTQGIPDLSDDLHEINPKWNNILVFDDLMTQAMDSSVLSRLFTQGRHRNASVILLLQNMFPKGKFNTDISRNAQYLVLFRSPSDRKQIDMIAERIFAKDRPNFMSVYGKLTTQPYGYVLIDNQPKTHSQHQVVSHIFETCQCYPTISTQSIEPSYSREVNHQKTQNKQPQVKKRLRKPTSIVKKQVRCKREQTPERHWEPFKYHGGDMNYLPTRCFDI